MKPIPFVTAADFRGDFCIHLRFDDGVEKTVDFRPYLHGPVFVPLMEPAFFKTFRIEGGTVAWPNGADIAPETLHAAPAIGEAA